MVKLTGRVFDMMGDARRKLVGELVRDERARRGLTIDEAAQIMSMNPRTLKRVQGGAATVQDVTLRQVEGAFDWPMRFLTYIIAGDVGWIERIEGLRPDLRQFVIARMLEIEQQFEHGE